MTRQLSLDELLSGGGGAELGRLLDAAGGRPADTPPPTEQMLRERGELHELWIPGYPAPQGSKVASAIYRGSRAKGTREFTGKVTMREQTGQRHKDWRKAVHDEAERLWAGRAPLDGPLLVGMAFVLPPWKSTKPGQWPIGSRTGDTGKLVRAVEDALTTSGVWVDDRLVVGYLGWPLTGKRFAVGGEPTGCHVRLLRAPAAAPGPERPRSVRSRLL